jgi:hypothetical protein
MLQYNISLTQNQYRDWVARYVYWLRDPHIINHEAMKSPQRTVTLRPRKQATWVVGLPLPVSACSTNQSLALKSPRAPRALRLAEIITWLEYQHSSKQEWLETDV